MPGITKLVLIFLAFILLFMRSCLQYNTMHAFSVWLGTGTNPADINRFGKIHHIFSYSSKPGFFLFPEEKKYVVNFAEIFSLHSFVLLAPKINFYRYVFRLIINDQTNITKIVGMDFMIGRYRSKLTLTRLDLSHLKLLKSGKILFFSSNHVL